MFTITTTDSSNQMIENQLQNDFFNHYVDGQIQSLGVQNANDPSQPINGFYLLNMVINNRNASANARPLEETRVRNVSLGLGIPLGIISNFFIF